MGSERVRALLDDLKHGIARAPLLSQANSAAPSPADNPLGLAFAIGARVLDLITGERGFVQWSGRDASTNVELFRVQLADASIHWRTKEQLEPMPAAVAR
jgi:hypothetical protein